MCSVTVQRGGNMTKSAIATPGRTDGQVKTVKMEGSYTNTCRHEDNATHNSQIRSQVCFTAILHLTETEVLPKPF